MNKFELCVSLIVNDIKADLDGYYKDFGIKTYAEYLEETGRDSKAMKEDVRYILADYSDFHINANLYLNDCDELELEDGSILTYRKLINAVRKQLKEEGYFE